jgi:hypothetical protein
MEFLREYKAMRERKQACEPTVMNNTADSANVEQDKGLMEMLTNYFNSNNNENLNLDALNADQQRLVWIGWQRRLNATIFEKLVASSRGQEIPCGLLQRVQYKVTPYHSFAWTLTGSGHAQFDKLVSSAITETLHDHPELKQFPPGVTPDVHEHEATFTTGGLAGYSTTTVTTDWRVRY